MIAVDVRACTAGGRCLIAAGFAAAGTCAPGGSSPASSAREPVREDRAEERDADRAADLAEERRARGRDAEVLVVDRVLRGEHEHLHHAIPSPRPRTSM